MAKTKQIPPKKAKYTDLKGKPVLKRTEATLDSIYKKAPKPKTEILKPKKDEVLTPKVLKVYKAKKDVVLKPKK